MKIGLERFVSIFEDVATISVEEVAILEMAANLL